MPILRAIDELKLALSGGAMERAAELGLRFGVPVGLGVIVGVVGVSNVLRVLLKRYPGPTLGVLLGLLLGAVVGLWPFQHGVRPEAGEVIRGRTMTTELLARLDPDDYPTRYFNPSAAQVAGALGLILAGFGATFAISRLGGEGDTE